MSEFFDDDNYNDGFNEDAYEQGMDLGLWQQLLAYTLSYPRDVLILALCAVCTAGADIAFPLITRAVIDSVGRGDGSFDPYFYGACISLSSSSWRLQSPDSSGTAASYVPM